jgi:hypothetical protein
MCTTVLTSLHFLLVNYHTTIMYLGENLTSNMQESNT